MLRSTILNSRRPLPLRLRLVSGVMFSILGTAFASNAQPQQLPASQDQQTPAPQSPQPSAPEPELKTPASPAAKPILPQIVVNPVKRTKPKTTASAPPRPASQIDATTAAYAALDNKMIGMDQARNNLLTTIGASSDTMSRQAILNMPQGDYTPIDKVILQFPGVSMTRPPQTQISISASSTQTFKPGSTVS